MPVEEKVLFRVMLAQGSPSPHFQHSVSAQLQRMIRVQRGRMKDQMVKGFGDQKKQA